MLPLVRQEHGRFLSGNELMASHTLPTTSLQARLSGTPKLKMEGLSESNKVRMSGNAMNVPCVGCIIMCCVLGLECIKETKSP